MQHFIFIIIIITFFSLIFLQKQKEIYFKKNIQTIYNLGYLIMVIFTKFFILIYIFMLFSVNFNLFLQLKILYF